MYAYGFYFKRLLKRLTSQLLYGRHGVHEAASTETAWTTWGEAASTGTAWTTWGEAASTGTAWTTWGEAASTGTASSWNALFPLDCCIAFIVQWYQNFSHFFYDVSCCACDQSVRGVQFRVTVCAKLNVQPSLLNWYTYGNILQTATRVWCSRCVRSIVSEYPPPLPLKTRVIPSCPQSCWLYRLIYDFAQRLLCVWANVYAM